MSLLPGVVSVDRPGTAARGSAAWLAGGLVAAALLAGVALRFVAPADLWLDEAQSVAIARLPLPELFTALRQDGSPPLYSLLLHGWVGVFGQGAVAVRALSGLLGVLALPLAWVLGREVAGRRGAVVLTLLLASNPFLIRYSSETRMYSLLVLLVLATALAARWAVRSSGPVPVVALALGAAALLLTHYWAAYLIAVAGLLALAGLRRHRRPALRVLVALGLAALAFLPWLPSLRFQLAHTGTPWAEVGGLSVVPTALTAWRGGGSFAAVLLGHAQFCLAALGLVAVPVAEATAGGRPPVVGLGVTRSRTRWSLLALSAGTVVLAGLASLLTDSAVSSRYTSVAVPAYLALVAAGLVSLAGRRAGAALLAVVVVLGLAVAAAAVRTPRTQAGQVAAALAGANLGDTVAFCPDQLGPQVSRLAPPGLDMVVYPDLGPADRVDWTDYAERNDSADPAAVAAALSARAGDHAIWVVSGNGYRVPSDADCRELRTVLGELRGKPEEVVARDPGVPDSMRMHRFPAA
ncbi:Dolichyl-phosphate-mannose-protein mannosyltransferase [Modestobacter sp. DSM 44400]|uniref:glycosyltransferase family 39 protein n=1 Tax=Modestobacter sp. DSM 44400 TaxID=1550230 RepID=UPI0008948C99|nr:glycosyltransferase family 39 protein [Modestobacter sp. DSM 44400]SDX66461.1 Dolichyl-phosphate-mannose-protein mannosyltransferase [Modestobacter sp. DSM 44400]